MKRIHLRTIDYTRYTATREVHGHELTFTATLNAIYVEVYKASEPVDAVSAYNYSTEKSRVNSPEAFAAIVDKWIDAVTEEDLEMRLTY